MSKFRFFRVVPICLKLTIRDKNAGKAKNMSWDLIFTPGVSKLLGLKAGNRVSWRADLRNQIGVLGIETVIEGGKSKPVHLNKPGYLHITGSTKNGKSGFLNFCVKEKNIEARLVEEIVAGNVVSTVIHFDFSDL